MHKRVKEFLCKIGLHKWVPDKVVIREYEFTTLYTDAYKCERCKCLKHPKGVAELFDQVKVFELMNPGINRR